MSTTIVSHYWRLGINNLKLLMQFFSIYFTDTFLSLVDSNTVENIIKNIDFFREDLVH